MRRISHDIYSIVFGVVYLGLVDQRPAARSRCLPLVIAARRVPTRRDPGRSWRSRRRSCWPARVAAAFTVFRELRGAADRGRARVPARLARHLAAGARVSALIVAASWCPGRRRGRVSTAARSACVVVPVLAVFAVMAGAVAASLSLVAVAEAPAARLRDVVRASRVPGVAPLVPRPRVARRARAPVVCSRTCPRSRSASSQRPCSIWPGRTRVHPPPRARDSMRVSDVSLAPDEGNAIDDVDAARRRAGPPSSHSRSQDLESHAALAIDAVRRNIADVRRCATPTTPRATAAIPCAPRVARLPGGRQPRLDDELLAGHAVARVGARRATTRSATLALAHAADFARRVEQAEDIDTHDLGFLYTLSCVRRWRLLGDADGARRGAARRRPPHAALSRAGGDHPGLGRPLRSDAARSHDHRQPHEHAAADLGGRADGR